MAKVELHYRAVDFLLYSLRNLTPYHATHVPYQTTDYRVLHIISAAFSPIYNVR